MRNYHHIISKLTVIPGGKGVFDVHVDDRLIFSKKGLGRHAEPGEILSLFRDIVGPDVPVYPQSD